MLPPYFMAGVNVILFLVSFSSFLLLKKYSKYHVYSLPFLLLFTCLPLISIARMGTYESGDLSLNVYKTMELWNALSQGYILPSWAGNLNATYGYPLFTFTYPLPYYINVFFHLVGLSFVSSVKMTLASSYLLSGMGMFYFLKQRFTAQSAFTGAILYLYTPYHLVNMHFRVDIGEMWAIAFIPLIFLSLEKISQKIFSPFWISVGAFTIALIILSHQAVSLTTLPFVFFYIFIINTFDFLKKNWLRYFLVFLGGLLLSGFYVFPLLYLKEFTVQSLRVSISYAPFLDLLYSPYRFGLLFQGPNGELSFLLGYVQLVLIILGLWILRKGEIQYLYKRLLVFSLSGIGILVFFMLNISEPLWFIIPLIKNFQFSYRLLAVILFFFGLLGAIIAMHFKKDHIIFLLLFFTILTTILNWGNRRTIPDIGDKQLAQGLSTSTYYGEGLTPAAPKWVDTKNVWMKDIPPQPLEVLSGKATITSLKRKMEKHNYKITATQQTRFKENTLYFPNWTVYANQKPISISYTDPHFPGIITFSLPKGTYNLDVIYHHPLVTPLSRFTSLGVVLLLTLWNLIFYRRFLLALVHKNR